jgi:hypothetical protein
LIVLSIVEFFYKLADVIIAQGGIMMRLIAIFTFALFIGDVAFSASGSSRGSRKKILTQEKMVKSGKGTSSTKINFDAVDISGERKMPLGSNINQTRSNKDGGFVKIRTEWHEEMVQSASSL